MIFRRSNSGSMEDSLGKGKVLSILNQKGGVGKTTMAFNLAHALKHQGKKVLCIDMDPQGNLSLLFDLEEKEHHIFHLLINTIRELKGLHSPVVVTDVIEKKNGIDILPSGQDLAGFELSIAGINSPRQLVLKRFLEKNNLYEHYDYIILDGPPTLGLLVVNILCASHGVLVPFLPDQFSRKGLGLFHGVIDDVNDMGITETPKIIGYIPNLVEMRRRQSQSDFDKIAQDISEEKILDPIPNRVQLVKSGAKRKSVFDFQSKEYAKLQTHFSKMASLVERELV